MVPSDADTSVSGAAIIAATIHILYKKKKDMRGMALIDASPTISMDTSTYDALTAEIHANGKKTGVRWYCSHVLCTC